MPIIAPSVLAADFLHLAKDCELINQSQADWFHIDIMDGNFVPNISFGPMIVQQIRTTTKKVCDVHLMIVQPEKYIDEFKKAGADVLTVHLEACPHLHRTIQQIKSLDMQAGVALNPHTSVNLLENIIIDIDLVCVMSVNPGFGGQKFIDNTFEKVKQLKSLIQQKKSKAKIEIDGGVGLANAKALIDSGADVLVAGTTVFKAKDPIKMIADLKGIL